MEETTQNNQQNNEPKDIKEEVSPVNDLEKITKERDEYLDGWKRSKADFINYKKDEVKRFESFIKGANDQIIRELIVVLDSFDLGLQVLEKDSKIEKGIFLIRTQLEDVLKKYGLERINVSPGQPFDPSIHDAIAEVESDKPSGTIVEEVERGYLIFGRVIRATRVKVAK